MSHILRAAAVAAVAAVAAAGAAAQTARETVAGVTNFGRVTERYFRGGKVTPEGVENLYRLGVRTIVDLRDEPSLGEPEACERLGIRYVKMPFDGHAAPDAKAVDEVLGIIRSARAPVYVHCSAGKHRAGTICALYRMRVEGWSADRAWAEQQYYGFGARGEHPELYAFAYSNSGVGAGSNASLARATAAVGDLAAPALAAPPSTSAAAPMAGLTPSGAYLPLADVLGRAKAAGGTGDVLKIDLEWDLERAAATWDVTFANGVEYEFDAVSGALLGTKQKTAAKLATMLPIGVERGATLKGFAEVMRGAQASAGRAVQEMELKRVKGQERAIFEVVLVDGTTIFYDAATGAQAL